MLAPTTANGAVQPAPPSTIIAGRNISFAYGAGELRKQVLFDVSFDIFSGEFVSLTGPSGSGKTTLLTLTAALRTMQAGQLTVLEQDLTRATTDDVVALRRKIGFIFQAQNLLDFLTACDNVALMFQLHPEVSLAEAHRKSEEMLAAVGLGNFCHRYPRQLSGGQRQRVAIARALAWGPQLVLADEPTSALDSQSGREVVKLLHTLSRQTGCPILMVTHDVRVLDFADRVIHFEDGRIASN
jgi:putative ABC transport system ATP-binding protein